MSATATGGHESDIELRRRGPRVPARLLRLASDERLVEALRGGSDAAFEVIYSRHHRGVLSFCRHMLGSVEEAEDAVQHTFLAAYHDLLRSAKPIRLRPWLYTIARNRCLSVLRTRRERAPDEPAEPSTEHLSQEVERRHDLRALLGDVAGLPHDQRAALVLAELGDMSHDDIARVLGCPREKVKGLVFQARTSLIASRTARETPCAEVRELLANLQGGSLTRNTVRRHLRECPGCREYRDEVRAQRSALALILPVAPSLGLKATVLGAAGVTAAAGGGPAALVATGVVALCAVGGGTAAVEIARDDNGPRERPSRVVPAAAPAGAVAVPVHGSSEARPGERSKDEPPRGAAVTPVAAGHEATGRGRNRTGARPLRARGPKPKAGHPVQAGGPKPKAGHPVEAGGPKPKRAQPVDARGPKLEAARPVKAQGPKPKAAKPVKAQGPKPKAAKPVKAQGSKPAASKAKAPKPAKAKAAEPKAPEPKPASPAAERRADPQPSTPARSVEPAPPADPPGQVAKPGRAKG